MRIVFTAVALTATLFVAGAATAASQAPASNDSASAQTSTSVSADDFTQSLNHNNLRRQLQQQLSSAGYSSITIMPSSFYVQAKNKDGQPVAMVIGPDSFVSVTQMNNGAGGKQVQSSTGQPSANGGAQNSTKQP